jgi:hypothetical protein
VDIIDRDHRCPDAPAERVDQGKPARLVTAMAMHTGDEDPPRCCFAEDRKAVDEEWCLCLQRTFIHNRLARVFGNSTLMAGLDPAIHAISSRHFSIG